MILKIHFANGKKRKFICVSCVDMFSINDVNSLYFQSYCRGKFKEHHYPMTEIANFYTSGR